ncbi:glucosamine-6-phosphate deaminase [Klebsiella spallanzanii]|uniref:glucosamine-6-phosphate deaminase n=1 Tax=Klebsiella spallanzanii TaxID=2587528 RepID=UPI00115BA28F|nr:glucosamine-6-phosphate deaminase [Klebsiella spallanzanii]VUS28964.1 Glucosamine-6-phosphate deaminase 1 [Klebsiella spallanzanii]
MHIYTQETESQLAQAISLRIIEQLQQRPDSLLCLAGGETTLPVFRACVAAQQAGKADFSRCRFVSLDEWIGLGREDTGSCLQTLSDELFQPLALRSEQIVFFDGKAADLQNECRKIDAAIDEHGGLDLVVLGVGMNGHIGFNEPGVNCEQNSHIEPLDEVTRTIAPKYFNRPQPVTQGITLGIQQLRAARQILLMITGAHKAGIVEQFISTPVGPHFPASLLRDLPQTTFWTDRAIPHITEDREEA